MTDLDALERMKGFAQSLTGDFNSVTLPGSFANRMGDDLRSILSVAEGLEEAKAILKALPYNHIDQSITQARAFLARNGKGEG